MKNTKLKNIMDHLTQKHSDLLEPLVPLNAADETERSEAIALVAQIPGLKQEVADGLIRASNIPLYESPATQAVNLAAGQAEASRTSALLEPYLATLKIIATLDAATPAAYTAHITADARANFTAAIALIASVAVAEAETTALEVAKATEVLVAAQATADAALNADTLEVTNGFVAKATEVLVAAQADNDVAAAIAKTAAQNAYIATTYNESASVITASTIVDAYNDHTARAAFISHKIIAAAFDGMRYLERAATAIQLGEPADPQFVAITKSALAEIAQVIQIVAPTYNIAQHIIVERPYDCVQSYIQAELGHAAFITYIENLATDVAAVTGTAEDVAAAVATPVRDGHYSLCVHFAGTAKKATNVDRAEAYAVETTSHSIAADFVVANIITANTPADFAAHAIAEAAWCASDAEVARQTASVARAVDNIAAFAAIRAIIDAADAAEAEAIIDAAFVSQLTVDIFASVVANAAEAEDYDFA